MAEEQPTGDEEVQAEKAEEEETQEAKADKEVDTLFEELVEVRKAWVHDHGHVLAQIVLYLHVFGRPDDQAIIFIHHLQLLIIKKN